MANYKNIFIMMPAKDAEDYSGAFTLVPQRQGFVLLMVSFANCASNEDKTGNLPIPGARQDWRSRWSAMLPGPVVGLGHGTQPNTIGPWQPEACGRDRKDGRRCVSSGAPKSYCNYLFNIF
jgi:hypothetical protein